MRDAILNFHTQFSFQPKVQYANTLKKKKYVLVCGMGGSHLAADLLKTIHPELPLFVHSDYGLPKTQILLAKETLVIISSYSGNTKEAIDGYREARKRHLPIAAISVGGQLLKRAKKDGVPFVALPDTGIQPRSALGFSLLGLLALLGRSKDIALARRIGAQLKKTDAEHRGRNLAKQLRGRVPVIYSSRTNQAIAYNWKIKFNETGKIPAFYNVLPELNHNEMSGFDVKPSSRILADHFVFIFLTDKTDHPNIQKRMSILKRLYEDRGLPVREALIEGKDPFIKVFSSLLFADWTALALADYYGLEPDLVTMQEAFKKSL